MLECVTCEGLNFSRGDLISHMIDFSRLCFTGIVVLCLQQSRHRETTLTLAQKRGCGLWDFLYQLLVCEMQTSTSCSNIHILFISILICFCCCSWCLPCPCTTLAQSSPSTTSSPLTVITVAVHDSIWGLGSSSRNRYGVMWRYCDSQCVRYQNQQHSHLTLAL